MPERMRPAWAVLAALGFGTWLLPAAAPPVPRPTARQLAKLVADLGADDFATREAADRALAGLGAEAVPALWEGTKSPDPEARSRSVALALRAEKRATAYFEALGAKVRWNSDGKVHSVSFDGRDSSRLRDEHLRELVGFPWLVQLRLDNAPVGDAGMPSIGRLTKVDWLVLSGTRVTDSCLAHLAGLTNLEILVLHRTRVVGPGLAHLGAMKRLQTLYVDRSGLTDAGLAAGMSGIKRLEGLRNLGLSGTRVGDTGLAAAVTGLKGLKELCHLGLSGTRVTDDGLGCLGQLEQPIFLDLADTRITDRGVARLRAMRNLFGVHLHRTAVTDEGCAHLARIRTINQIDLDETRVTVAGLRPFKNLPHLQVLSIRSLKLSEREVEGLLDVMPERVHLRTISNQNSTRRGRAAGEEVGHSASFGCEIRHPAHDPSLPHLLQRPQRHRRVLVERVTPDDFADVVEGDGLVGFEVVIDGAVLAVIRPVHPQRDESAARALVAADDAREQLAAGGLQFLGSDAFGLDRV